MNENTKEKICAFYASDYHFEMISLPYIDKRIENNEEIIILTENDLEDTIKKLLERTNLKEEKKKKILQLNWKNNDVEKLEMLKNKIKNKKEVVIFIKGKKKYIQHLNHNIDKCILEAPKIKIIDCYSMEEVGEDVDSIMEQYPKILRTAGEKEIEKL